MQKKGDKVDSKTNNKERKEGKKVGKYAFFLAKLVFSHFYAN